MDGPHAMTGGRWGEAAPGGRPRGVRARQHGALHGALDPLGGGAYHGEQKAKTLSSPPCAPYAELHAASSFSFLEGASTPEALVERAAALGLPAIALLDRDGLYGAPRFHLAAKAAGIKGLIGAELTIRAGGTAAVQPPTLWRLPVLVATRDGYRRLCRLITKMKLGAAKGEGTLALSDLDGETGGLVALVGRAALDTRHYGVGGLLDRVVGLFGRDSVHVELQRHFLRDEAADTEALVALASAYRVPVVATNGVRFACGQDRPLFDVLACVRHGTTLARAGRRLASNAERCLKPAAAMADLFRDLPHAVSAAHELADRLAYTMADLGYRFPDYPVPAGETQATFLRRMAEVGARDRYRPYHDRARAQVQRELDLIEKLDLAGYFLIVWDIVNFCRQHGILAQGRGSAANSAVCYSLGITAVDPVGMELLFERFLSEQRGEWPDIDLDLPSGDRREQVIQYVYRRYGAHGAAMTANVITYRGRSAAREVGKALDLDQALVDRLAKAMMPFEWRDPAETLLRQLGDAGIDASDHRVRHFADLWRRIQHLPRHLGQHSGGMVICQGRLDEVVPLEPASMPGRVVIQWDKEDCADLGLVKVDLLGLGMMAALQDALTIINTGSGQWPVGSGQRDIGMGSGEGPGASDQGDVGPRQVGARHASPDPCLDLAHLPPDDPAVYRMLQDADTVGVFQVESRAQMATLPRIKPAHFYDLVVEVAIIRPGPIVGQMVHPYIDRRNGRAPVEYPHPSLEPILKRTLGVPLFQEQLLRIAMVAAGFSGGEAEELRRAMGFKRSEQRMRQIETRLRAGMARNGIEGEAADAIVRSITSFALYGFPESHAASFALIVYASAYLKAHYPAAFYAALLDNQPMGFYHPATLVKDAQRHGVRFAPIDVQASAWRCRIEADGRVRLGLMYVRGLREGVAQGIASAPCTARLPAALVRCPGCGASDQTMLERIGQRGDAERWFCNVCARSWDVSGEPARFRSIDHLVAVSGARRDELARLAEIGALNSLGHDRRSALWQVEQAVRPAGALFEEGADETVGRGPWAVDSEQDAGDGGTADVPAAGDRPHEGMPTDSRSTVHPPRPAAVSPLRPMTDAERVVADYDGTGLTIGPHPMALRRRDLALRGVLRAVDLPRVRPGRRVRIAGAVITRQRPGTAKGFCFLTLEDETGIANVIVRPDVFDAQRTLIVHEPFVMVDGLLQQQDGVTSVRAERVTSLRPSVAAQDAEGTGEPASLPAVESHDFR
jgi:error-prone DNA polymerase